MSSVDSIAIFNQLPASERRRLRAAALVRDFTSEEVIFKEGDPGDGVYVVREGAVQIAVIIGEDGQQKVFSMEGPGSLFGEMTIIDNEPRSASAIASGGASTWFIPREVMLDLMEASPAFATQLMQGITRRLREFNRRYVREVLQTERLALVGRFTRSIVHDLKNPLNIIGIAADMATQKDVSQDLRVNARERIRKQVGRITGLVNEVMDFTRSANTTFVLALMEYSTLVRQALDDILPEVNLRGIELAIVNDPPVARVTVSPERINRLLHNLLVNACEAMPEGGRVELRFEDRGQQVVTSIRDRGPGISDEVRDNLFEAFVTHGKAHGTGLGLSICRRIVEDHRGKIAATNHPEGGAVFEFSLPVARRGETARVVKESPV